MENEAQTGQRVLGSRREKATKGTGWRTREKEREREREREGEGEKEVEQAACGSRVGKASLCLATTSQP